MQKSAPRATLTTEAIETLLQAATQRAKELDIRVHIAITDASAEIVGFLSFEGAPKLAATTAPNGGQSLTSSLTDSTAPVR